jgi:hypothetical protein
MGATLVTEVLARWTHVSDRAFRVLVRMAVTALDEPNKDTPAAVYFGGRELLAMTLRSDKGSPASRYRVVARVCAELVKLGAIERADAGRAGHNAVYRLTLDSARAIDDDRSTQPTQGGQFSHPQGGQISHPQGGQIGPSRVANLATPRNQEEPLEELLEETRGDLQTASHPSRAHTDEPKPPSVVVEIFPGASKRPPVGGRRWSDAAMEAVADASARRAAAVAAHRAGQEA